MDNARWVVVLSVIFSMMTVLTLLHKYARGQNPQVAIADSENAGSVRHQADDKKPSINRPSRREPRRVGKVSFPKPPVHTLAVEQPRDFERMRESIKVEGNIIK